ncbi:MAG: ATP-dependent Clp protease proteolytic subunit [Candidatus Buchananbacteria bacterium]|nr:ATP-dependent Clp protease proteolytic subunit [Candidatus Buchananbacteria bacterium]
MWKYDHIDETRQRLLSKGIIDLGGEVDEDMAMYVRDSLMILATNDNPEITIVFTSNGGSVVAGLAIYDMLKNYPGRKIGRVSSFCRSIAAIVLQACDWRIASPNSEIKIHNVAVQSLGLDVLRHPKKIDECIKDMERDQGIINQIYSFRTGQSLRAITRESNRDELMTAQEALEFGLIDEII